MDINGYYIAVGSWFILNEKDRNSEGQKDEHMILLWKLVSISQRATVFDSNRKYAHNFS